MRLLEMFAASTARAGGQDWHAGRVPASRRVHLPGERSHYAYFCLGMILLNIQRCNT